MRSFLTIFTVLISAMLTSALVARSGPSGTSCVYVCPPQDDNNKSLGYYDNTSNPLYCQYGSSMSHYCNYSKTTGVRTSDKDEGNCPAKAVCQTSTRRRDALPRSPRPRNSARQVDTSVLKTRNQLGAAKRGKRSA